MRGQLLVVLLLPFTIIKAETVTLDYDANQFIVAMAGQRALDEMSFSTQSSITKDNLSIQTDQLVLAASDVSRYTAEPAAVEIRGLVLLKIKADGRNRSTCVIEVKLEKHADDDSWITVGSNGVLEMEINRSIQYYIERYRKAASLN